MLYHPFYCEENVWHLCHDPQLSARPLDVVFISNPTRSVEMWHQRAGRGHAIVWDYHVIAIARDAAEVWDLDTDLGLPMSRHDYFDATFHAGVAERFEPWFRFVDAHEFVEAFASDRSHMRNERGRFFQPPPPWPPIGEAGTPSTLMRFVDMSHPFVGRVVSLADMLA